MGDNTVIALLVAVLGATAAIIAPLVPLMIRPSKAKLRADLEILDLLGKVADGHELQQTIERSVTKRLAKIYAPPTIEPTELASRIGFGVVTLLLTVGSGYWTALIWPTSWWGLATGWLTLGFLIWTIAAIVVPTKQLRKILPEIFD